jgi:hypothetical protein
MKMMIFDFETLGTSTHNCAVLDCSLFVFDTDLFLSDPYTLETVTEIKTLKPSVKDQVDNYGYKVSNDTIKFWSEQSKEVRDRIKPRPTDITLEDFVDQFIDYVASKGIKYWWSRSNSFDPIILWRMAESVGRLEELHRHLPHYKLRDTRTYIDAKLRFPKKNSFTPIKDETLWEEKFKLHNSSWDILADILRIQAIARIENDLEMI